MLKKSSKIDMKLRPKYILTFILHSLCQINFGGLNMVKVEVDQTKCNGDSVCIGVCPVAVFEMQDVSGEQKAVVVNNDACIVCRACEIQCPTQAITVTE